MRFIRHTLAFAALIAVPISAQVPTPSNNGATQTVNAGPAIIPAAPAHAPTLTVEEKQSIQIALDGVEKAQLKTQLIAQEYERARATLQQVIAAVTARHPGYQLAQDPEQGFALVKVEPKKEPEKK